MKDVSTTANLADCQKANNVEDVVIRTSQDAIITANEVSRPDKERWSVGREQPKE